MFQYNPQEADSQEELMQDGTILFCKICNRPTVSTAQKDNENYNDDNVMSVLTS
jgi:hypothetical protein